MPSKVNKGKQALLEKTRTAFLADLESDRKSKEKARKFAELRSSKAVKKTLRKTERASIKKARLSQQVEPTSPRDGSSASEDESPQVPSKSVLRSAARSGSDVELSGTQDADKRISDTDSDFTGESAGEGDDDSGEEPDQPGSPSGQGRRPSVALTKRSRDSTVGFGDVPRVATGADQEKKTRLNEKSFASNVKRRMRKATNQIKKMGGAIGDVMGVTPSKKQKEWVQNKIDKLLRRDSRVVGKLPSELAIDDGEDSSDATDSDDSDYQLMKQMHLRRTKRPSRVPVDGMYQHLNARARESLGIPEDDEDWSVSLRWQRRLGLLGLRLKLEMKRIQVAENPPQPSLKALVTSLKFECAIGAFILMNAITSGMDAMYKPGEKRAAIIGISENIFVFVFLVEYLLRVRADTWVWMFEPVNCFDTFVVWITGVLVVWILEPMGYEIDALRRLAAFRVLRLGRLAKAARTTPQFRELWMLVSGVLECSRLLFWSFVIIIGVHFMFAVLVMEIITKSETFADDPIVHAVFPDLFYTMFTLFQIMTFDSWAGIVRPIILKMPETTPIFGLFLGTAGIVLVNLMTAVVVKNAFDAADADEEAKAHAQVVAEAKTQAELKHMFNMLDEDGSGALSREEFTDVLDDVGFLRQMKMLDIDLEELPDIFDILDDGDGEVTTEEFCMGICRLQGVAMSRDMLRCTSRNRLLNAAFTGVAEKVGHEADRTLTMTEGCLESSHENLVELQQLTAEVLKKLDEMGIYRTVYSTGETLDELPLPTLESVAKKEQEEAKKQDMERMKAQMKGKAKRWQKAEVVQVVVEKPKTSTMMKPIPASFSLTRKKEKEEAILERTIRARMDQALLDEAAEEEEAIVEQPEEPVELPGVPKEFEKQWNNLEVKVPMQSAASRVVRIKASMTKRGKAAEKEKQEREARGEVDRVLPANLPQVLAPQKPMFEEPKQEEPKEKDKDKDKDEKQDIPEEELPWERKDLTKCGIKELREMCVEHEIDPKGWRKAKLLEFLQKIQRDMLAEESGVTPESLV
eukprot:TRINITY_DN1408_c0_g3_i1.p1 TRINITY_DN1408_c0_g3~~TRINITY_DN1408_c0_g3_i1.p1  ORF type:complete len:1031 (-),score=230.78 TRINITY_DN1408_c0_g3_i1:34-3126(-)